MTFGEKIAKLRKEENLTQEQLADLLGVSRQSISKWESGLAYPETEKLVKLGKMFHCSMDYLLNDDVTEKQPAAPVPAESPAVFSRRMQLPERKSKKMIFGMPLYHIGKNAHGFFAVGLKARGVFSLGLFSRGIVSMGLLSCGVFSFGILSLGLMAMGCIAVGLLAAGAIAVGLMAFGAISVGYFSVGALAVGKYAALGDHARGCIALGNSVAEGSVHSCIGQRSAADLLVISDWLDAHVPGWLNWAKAIFKGCM